jgi:hypothetical protein
MAKINWPRVLTSVALSGTASGFLIWRIFNPAAPVDAWTVALVVVIFLPWLRTVFERIEFPGGAAVTYLVEKVEKEQERQAEELDAMMRFLIAKFVSEADRDVLRRFASNEPITANPEDDVHVTQVNAQSVRTLKRLGLIDTKPEILALAKSGGGATMTNWNEVYDLTDSGRKYLGYVAGLRTED